MPRLVPHGLLRSHPSTVAAAESKPRSPDEAPPSTRRAALLRRLLPAPRSKPSIPPSPPAKTAPRAKQPPHSEPARRPLASRFLPDSRPHRSERTPTRPAPTMQGSVAKPPVKPPSGKGLSVAERIALLNATPGPALGRKKQPVALPSTPRPPARAATPTARTTPVKPPVPSPRPAVRVAVAPATKTNPSPDKTPPGRPKTPVPKTRSPVADPASPSAPVPCSPLLPPPPTAGPVRSLAHLRATGPSEEDPTPPSLIPRPPTPHSPRRLSPTGPPTRIPRRPGSSLPRSPPVSPPPRRPATPGLMDPPRRPPPVPTAALPPVPQLPRLGPIPRIQRTTPPPPPLQPISPLDHTAAQSPGTEVGKPPRASEYVDPPRSPPAPDQPRAATEPAPALPMSSGSVVVTSPASPPASRLPRKGTIRRSRSHAALGEASRSAADPLPPLPTLRPRKASLSENLDAVLSRSAGAYAGTIAGTARVIYPDENQLARSGTRITSPIVITRHIPLPPRRQPSVRRVVAPPPPTYRYGEDETCASLARYLATRPARRMPDKPLPPVPTVPGADPATWLPALPALRPLSILAGTIPSLEEAEVGRTTANPRCAKRRHVEGELAETEASYLTDLYVLWGVFRAPCASRPDLFPPKVLRTLFGNLEAVVTSTTYLAVLLRLAQAADGAPGEEGSRDSAGSDTTAVPTENGTPTSAPMSQRNVSNPLPPVRPPRSALRPRPSVGSALGFASSTSLASSTTPSVASAPVLSDESRQPRWSRASNPTDQRASVSSVSTCSEATVRLSASPATSVRLESEPAPGPFPAPATVHALLSQHLAASTQPPNVADVFCAMARQIREVYARYCTNFDTAMACLAQLQQESGPRQFLEVQQRQLAGKTHAWDLASLLIKPVQRVLKYPLLFQQLAKLTATADPAAHAAFASAHRKAEALADHLNLAKRRIALVHRILDGHGALVSVNLGASDRLAVAALAKRSAPRRPSVRDSPARLIHTRSSANLRSPTTPQSTSRPPSPPGEPRRLSHSRSHATLARRGQSTAGAGGSEAGLKELSTSLRAGLVRTLGRGRTSRGELATASPSSSTTATPAAAATPPSLSPRRRSSAGQEAYTALIARFDHQLAAAHTFRRHSEAWLYAVARWSARWVQLAHSCHDFLGPEPGPHTVLFRAEALVRHAALAETVVVRDAAKAVATEVWPALQCLVGLFHNPALVIRRHTERYIDHVRFATLRQQGDTPLPTERNLAEAAAEYEMLGVQLSAELPVFLRHAADLFTAVTNRFLAVQTAFYARCARDLRTRFFDGDVVLDRIAPDYRLALTVPTHPHRFSYVGPARDDEGWDDRLAASAADLTRIDTLNMVPIRPSLSASTTREPSATVALSLSEKLERIHDNIKWCVDKSRHRVSQASTVASTLTPEAPMPSLLHLPPDEYAAVAHPARVKNRPGLSRESSLSRRRAVLIDFLQDAGVTENASTLFLPTPEGEVPGDPFRTPDGSWSEAGSPHPSPPASPHRALPSFFDSLASLDSAATDLTPRTLSRQNSGPAPGVLSSVPRLPDVLLNRSDSWGLVGSLRSTPLTPADPFAGAEVRPADFVCFALSAYTAQAPYELNFAAGVPLVVRRVATLPTPEGPPAYWYHGELGPGGPRGWFPAEYALRNA